ncbi:extracellular solute-binding protein [Bosea sp. 124]|uniref:extracellular solute-binding protein n=1 Tax=Bosea sp. 124 TaxID=2135642 RepID=UPI000D3AED39|nr:extracellular solute-binding protein [Bosea sp. 124]PTM39993.1 iron(III) transport system substrate-binding protein [Bosea sp. 124]
MTKTIDRRTLLAGLAGLAAVPATGPALAQGASGNVVLYTSNNAQSVDAILGVAKDKLPNLKISTITGGSGQLLRRLEAEAAKPQGDLFWSSSANTLGAFTQLFEPYASPEAASIPAALRHPQNLWTASNVHLVVAMINKNQLGGAEAPKTWKDLLAPAFKGKIIIADPANSSTAYTILWGIDKLLGPDALKTLASNLTVSSAASTVLRSVAQGEYAVGLTFESNAYAYVAGGQREISLLYPAEGTFSTPEFQVLVKGAPAGATAKAAYDLLLSKEVQIALLENAFRRPSRSDIDVSKHADLPAIGSVKVFDIDETEAAAKRDEFLKRWQSYAGAAK